MIRIDRLLQALTFPNSSPHRTSPHPYLANWLRNMAYAKVS